ncbi:unnamed protein product [Linum trigynum]|uniref:Uncharacterized protein n=1 Tax=Linum trigynum TaxID=586398 RepID=A0AAV2CSF1_9ROSI
MARRQQQQQQASYGSSAAETSMSEPNPLSCSIAVHKVPDCMDQISQAVSTGYRRGKTPAGGGGGGSGPISPACCRVVNGLHEFCWWLLFTNKYYPDLPAELKALCSHRPSVPGENSG